MTPERQVRLLGRLLAVSVATLAAVAVLATRLLEPSAEPIFPWLVQGSATALVVLAMAGTVFLRPRVGKRGSQAAIVPMALTEGVALLGCVAAALAGQAVWVVVLAVVAIVVLTRMQTAALGSGSPG